jgi:hypothetical protein
LVELARQLRQALGFVEDGDDDGEHGELNCKRRTARIRISEIWRLHTG